MDFRNVRKQFIPKNMKYACSYDPEVRFDADVAMALQDGLRVTVASRGLGSAIGNFFHVLDEISVAGVDDRKHTCPVGKISAVDETILFRWDRGLGIVAGRMRVHTNDDATIDVTYTGRLRFQVPAAAALQTDSTLEGGAWIAPIFVTADTRYHWLAEHACVAFGTWIADPPAARGGTRNVTSKLDVYSTA
jgi:Protein of unknown function (DUF3237)